MIKVCMQRGPKHIIPGNGSWWEPVTKEDIEALEGKDEIIFQLKNNHSPRQHKKYWAFIGIAFKAQRRFANKTVFRKRLQQAAFQMDIEVDQISGETYSYETKIDWASLPEKQFKLLLTQQINAYMVIFGQEIDASTVDQLTRF